MNNVMGFHRLQNSSEKYEFLAKQKLAEIGNSIFPVLSGLPEFWGYVVCCAKSQDSIEV